MANSSDREARVSLRKRAAKARETTEDRERRLARKSRRVVELGPDRAVSNLDRQAMELGIYNADFHAKSRCIRKHLVSKALSQRNAA